MTNEESDLTLAYMLGAENAKDVIKRLQAEVAKHQWREVTETEPADDRVVVFKCERGCYIGTRDKEHTWEARDCPIWFDGEWSCGEYDQTPFTEVAPTLYLPLPELPEGNL